MQAAKGFRALTGAAPLKRWVIGKRYAVRPGFRALTGAAPLKHSVGAGAHSRCGRFPRLNRRGPIEATRIPQAVAPLMAVSAP